MENEKVKNNSSIDSIKEQDPIDLLKVDPTFSRLMHEYYKKQGIESDPELKARCLEFFDEHKKKLIAEGKIKNDWTNRIKDLDLSWVVRITVPVAATIFIIGMGVAIFYYFTDNKNTLPIANSPTPIVTSTPITNNPTPTPIPSVSPTIAENNKTNENNKLNGNPEKNNSVNVAKESNNANKINNIKNNSSNKDNVKIPNNENNKLDNEVGHNQSLIPPIETISKDGLRGEIKDLSLLEITNFYVASFGEEQENKELRQALFNRLKNTEFRVLTASEALSEDEYGEIKRNGQSIQIISGTNKKLLWQISIDGNNSSPKELADKIITQLLLDLKNK